MAAPRALAEGSGSGEGEVDTAPPQLSLKITESGPQLPWRVEVRNEGESPVRLAADPRLLWFEVKVPGKKKLETCRLPEDLFPSKPDKRTQMRLEPGEAAAKKFDPRLYCYAEGGQRQLVPGAQVIPHFGWPEKTKTTWKNGRRVVTVVDQPPYVARAASDRPGENEREAKDPDDAAKKIKVIEGERFALGSNYKAWTQSRLPPADESRGAFQLKLLKGSDAHAERTATIRLTLKNQSKRNRYVYFRRELVTFEVMGPRGLVQCDPEPDLRAPERHSYSYIPAGKSLTVTSRLVELCPRGTFGQPGLYLVHARFDATHDGEDYDLDAFVGRVVTRDAVGVRIRTGEKRPMRLHRVREERKSDQNEE